jgi:hypothetical protein
MPSSILINILLVSVVRAGYLSARKAFDPYIVCLGSLPGADVGWPTNYSPDNYGGSLLSLCSAANGNAGANVGCICTTSAGELHCDAGVADSNLYNAPPLTTGQTFTELCKSGCYCQYQTGSLRAIQFNRTNRPSPWENPPPNTATGGAGGSNGASSSSTGGGPNPLANIANTYINQCGNNCTTNADCTGGSDCTCRAQSQQVVPGAGAGVGTVQYLAACIIMLSTGVPGKRDEAWPCPCNATYVSHGCCDAKDGMVWESWNNKLGELAGAGEM